MDEEEEKAAATLIGGEKGGRSGPCIMQKREGRVKRKQGEDQCTKNRSDRGKTISEEEEEEERG